MSAHFRRPILSDTSPHIDEFFDDLGQEKTNGTTGARTLKPPPEIWELVHPVPTQQFKPTRALVGRIATPKMMLSAIAVIALSGFGVAAWKLQMPQKVAAIFKEPDAPVKKSAPATATVKRTPIEPTKSVPSSASSSTSESTVVESSPGASIDVVQTPVAALKRVVKKPVKSPVRVGDVVAPTPSAAVATTPAAVVTPKPKEVPSTTEQTPAGSKVSNKVSEKVVTSASDSTAAKPKAVATSSPQTTQSAPPKPNTSPKPKVIQWP